MNKILTKPNKYLLSQIFIVAHLVAISQKSTIDTSFFVSPPAHSYGVTPYNSNITTGNTFINPNMLTRPYYTNRKNDNLRFPREYKIVKRQLFPNFRKASLFYKDSTISENILINIESLNSYYIQVQNRGIINMASLKRVVFEKDGTEKDFTIFQNGYRLKKDSDADLLYQVLSSGKVDLLIKKFAVYEKDIIYSVQEWETLSKEIDILYIYVNNKLEKVKFNKKFFFEKFKEDKLEIMSEFVTLNKTNFKQIDDIQKLIRFYNNLPE